MKLESIKGVLFDMDGTIINSETLWSSVNEETLKHFNVPTHEPACKELIHSLAGVSTVEIWQKFKDTYSLNPSVEELMAHTFERAMNVFHERVAFIDGFEEFHQELVKRGIPTAVATNAPIAHLNEIAKRMNFDRFFGSNLFSVSHVNNVAKPDPTLFLYAARQLQRLPSECVVFEDSLPGFQAAKGAGIRCIAVEHDRNKPHRGLAHATISSYHDALEILKKL